MPMHCFCLSRDVTGPATLGYVDPDCAAAENLSNPWTQTHNAVLRAMSCCMCGERTGWSTIVEEIAGALPLVQSWGLVADRPGQADREQLVDPKL